MSAIYVQFICECENVNEVPNRCFEVVLKFENQEQLDEVGDTMFDQCYESFSLGLPDGWSPTDVMEIVRLLNEDKAKEIGYQIYTT